MDKSKFFVVSILLVFALLTSALFLTLLSGLREGQTEVSQYFTNTSALSDLDSKLTTINDYANATTAISTATDGQSGQTPFPDIGEFEEVVAGEMEVYFSDLISQLEASNPPDEIKADIEALKQEVKTLRQYSNQLIEYGNYFHELVDLFQLFSSSSETDFDQNLDNFKTLLSKVKEITPPPALQEYHGLFISDLDGAIAYLNQSKSISDKLKNPSSLSATELESLTQQLQNTGTLPEFKISNYNYDQLFSQDALTSIESAAGRISKIIKRINEYKASHGVI